MNFGSIGFAELLFLPALLLLGLLPIVVAVWAVLTLIRVRRLLEDIVVRLDRLAARGSPP